MKNSARNQLSAATNHVAGKHERQDQTPLVELVTGLFIERAPDRAALLRHARQESDSWRSVWIKFPCPTTRMTTPIRIAIHRTSSKISDQGDIAVERERVTLGRADYPPILGPVDKAVTAVRRGYHGVRTAFRKCPATADRAIGTRRGPDRNCVLFGVNGQRRKAGRAPLIASRVVEADIVYVGARPKAARFRVYRERYGLRRCRHGSGR
jgi:hypothetical protein